MSAEGPTTSSLRIVEVSGSPSQRGVEYGRSARAEIDRSIAYYSELFKRDYDLDWMAIVERAGGWRDVIREFDEELLTEVEGIAEGSGNAVDEIIALNARGEMVYGNAPREGCTSFAVLPRASDGHMYAGQNWDWRAGTRETWIVLRVVQPPKPTVITVVEAGQVGRYGANSTGLALFSNGLAGFWTPEPGVPQPFIRRRVLNCATLKGALEVILEAKQQIAANLLLAHRDGFAIDIETTPTERACIYPDDGLIVHANHYEALSGEEYVPFGADSLYRAARVREALRGSSNGERPRPVTGATIAAALSDHFGFPDSVCAHPSDDLDPLDRWQTLTSNIVDLTSGEWWITAGNPCSSESEPLPWNLYSDELDG